MAHHPLMAHHPHPHLHRPHRSKIASNMLEKSEIQEHYDSEWLCPEIWLILPVIQRRVDAGKATEAEKRAVEFVKASLPMLLLGDDEKGEGGGGVKEDMREPPSTSAASAEAESTGEVTGEEVLSCLKSLKIPALFEPSSLSASGFTVRQQTALIAQFGGRDASEAAANFSGFLTRPSWDEIKEELRFCSTLPTKANLIDTDGTPWNNAMRAFLRSPKVVLRSRTRTLMRMGGLAKLDDLYEEEKSGKRKRASSVSTAKRVPASEALNRVVSRHASRVIRREFEGGVRLSNIATIVNASFGYKSLTSKMTDVTEQVRSALDTRDGSLLLYEDDLILMRNKRSSVKAGADETRGALLKIATLGLVGKNKLVLEYTLIEGDGNGWEEADRVLVVEELQKAGVTKRLHEKEGGEYTFFKLVEWMQVEILALFADSLNHTPWFRFPFYEVGMEVRKVGGKM